jgi:hypothetical protein
MSNISNKIKTEAVIEYDTLVSIHMKQI